MPTNKPYEVLIVLADPQDGDFVTQRLRSLSTVSMSPDPELITETLNQTPTIKALVVAVGQDRESTLKVFKLIRHQLRLGLPVFAVSRYSRILSSMATIGLSSNHRLRVILPSGSGDSEIKPDFPSAQNLLDEVKAEVIQ